MAERFKYNFRFRELKIDIASIGRLLDYEKGDNRDMVSRMIEEGLFEAEDLSDIRAEFILYADAVVDREKFTIEIDEVSLNVGKIVSGQVRRSGSFAVFACTAGARIGDTARNLIQGKDFLKGYILDLIGSQAADIAADLMQEKLKALMKGRGLRITNRYSPGYCGWSVSEQHKLFALLPENYCGIKLNDSALMQPIKSVSGIIGIGEKVRLNKYTCNICDQQNCLYRNSKYSPLS